MKNLIIPILAGLVLIQSCTPTSKKLEADQTAKEIFNPAELKGIEQIVSFVDTIISNQTRATDINEAYHAYFNNLESSVADASQFPALIKDSIKFRFLATLDKEAFDALWKMDDYAKMVKYKDTILTDLHDFKSLVLNYEGKYMNYLKETGNSDSRYAEVYKSIEIAGDISPATVGWFLSHYQEFDFTLFKDRVWATVFLLRMCDPLEERVERYLAKKN